MKSILVISNGSNSGSEHALFQLLSTLEGSQIQIIVLNRYNDYQDLYSVPCQRYYGAEDYMMHRPLWQRISARVFRKDPLKDFFHRIIRQHRPELVYFNNWCLPEAYQLFFELDIPVVLHGHSLQHYLYAFDAEMLINRVKASSLVFSCSLAQRSVIKQLVPGSDPVVIYPPLFIKELVGEENSRSSTRRQLGVPEEGFVWAMASTYFNYNKDPDRFLEVGEMIQKASGREVFLLWIGGDPNSTAARLAVNKARQKGMERRLLFTGYTPRKDYVRYLSAADGFLLVSMEESFSIVSAEAIAMGKPVAAFPCGGVEEIITPQSGLLAPSFSLEHLAGSAVRIMDNVANYQPDTMRESVRRFDIGTIAPVWKEHIERVTSENRVSS